MPGQGVSTKSSGAGVFDCLKTMNIKDDTKFNRLVLVRWLSWLEHHPTYTKRLQV